MHEELETDYLVVGAGAAGMAFTDALLAHSDATVTIVDRRHAPGGHWIDVFGVGQQAGISGLFGSGDAIVAMPVSRRPSGDSLGKAKFLNLHAAERERSERAGIGLEPRQFVERDRSLIRRDDPQRDLGCVTGQGPVQ